MRRTVPVSLLLLVAALTAPAHAQTGRVTGKITDGISQRPLVGVTVTVIGSTARATTDTSGTYTIASVEPGSHLLRTARIGYIAAEERVAVAAGQTATVNLVLQASAVSLEAVVSIGYGSVQRRELTGAVASITSDELTKVPTGNVTESLQGQLPGVDIVRSSGSPNSGTSMLIRGARSLKASNNPLVIIDGVQFGSLAQLNPSDVESIEVLKDAASTAIYGSRGANGVILVSTKKGVGGRPSFDLNSYYGVTSITDYPLINTGPQFVALKREAYRTSGLWSSTADDSKIFTPDQIKAIQDGFWTDFRNLIFRDGVAQSHQLGVSAGSERTQAYISFGLVDETGVLRNDQMRRYALRVNVDQKLTDQWSLGTHSQVTYFDRDRRANPLNIANKIDPLTHAFASDGSLIVFPNNGKDISPLADEQPNAYSNNQLQSIIIPSLFANYSNGGFTFRSTLGGNLSESRTGTFASPNTISQSGAASQATYSTDNGRNYSLENVATYRREIGGHSVTLTGVGSYLSYKSDGSSVLGRNQLIPAQLYYSLNGAKDGIAISSTYEESSLLSGAGRLNYDWQNRYLFQMSGRFDGSSKLSQGNKWAFFPGLSAAWRISDEPFMRNKRFVDELKFRAAYGVSGNDAVSPYSTQASLVSIPFSFDETSAPGYTFSSQVGNSNLKWELSHTTNVGVDASLWNNRISASIDVYRTRTTDLLLQRFLPPSSGVSSVTQNIGGTQNRGIELSLNASNMRRENLTWSSLVTFTRNRERITDLVNGTNDIANGWFIGYPSSVFYDYQKTGIWQRSDSLEAAKFGQLPGDIRVKDQNNDGKITAAADRIVLGSPRPDWSGALTNNVQWKNFDFAATVFARMGQKMSYEFYDSYKPDGVENGAAVNYWTPEHPTNDFPRPNSRFPKTNYLYYSSLTYADGSFMKLRDATVGYLLPDVFARRFSASRARVYLSGRNLARWTKVPNYDPERGGSISDPMTRVFVTGFDIKF
jgi:TonB-dependent starch-binding outer membrane protein SusC